MINILLASFLNSDTQVVSKRRVEAKAVAMQYPTL